MWDPDTARRHETSVLLLGHLAANPDATLAAKFFAERAEYSHEVGFYLSHIGGAHVPKVVATVAPPAPPTGTPWGALIMERGDYSLAEWLANPRMRKAAPEAVKRGALRDAADALSLLHASDVVHRDVCPSNLVRRLRGACGWLHHTRVYRCGLVLLARGSSSTLHPMRAEGSTSCLRFPSAMHPQRY